ncbi:MAG: ABC transporter permease [Clostridioides sp.]|nr:ABC transporter permease [Clostridioides sp.]
MVSSNNNFTLKNILYKFFKMLLFIFVLSLFVFTLSRLAPIDPLTSYYGDRINRMSEAQLNNARKELGLDKSIAIQYKIWISNMFKGNFGISLKYKQDVLTIVGKLYKNTLSLGLTSFVVTFILALKLGQVCALKKDTLLDKILINIGTIVNNIPTFWIGVVFIFIFSIKLKLTASGGVYDIGQEKNFLNRINHMILPVSVLVLSHIWYYAFIIRNKIVDELGKDYVVFAISKGLSRKQVMKKHCMRNVFPLYISMIAMSIPHIISSTYIIESVFSYQGLGSLSIESAKYGDYNMLMIICLITGVSVLITGMISEIIIEKIDPRIKE